MWGMLNVRNRAEGIYREIHYLSRNVSLPSSIDLGKPLFSAGKDIHSNRLLIFISCFYVIFPFLFFIYFVLLVELEDMIRFGSYESSNVIKLDNYYDMAIETENLKSRFYSHYIACKLNIICSKFPFNRLVNICKPWKGNYFCINVLSRNWNGERDKLY